MPVYSHSGVGTFETCPRQYWFAYIEKPEIVRPRANALFISIPWSPEGWPANQPEMRSQRHVPMEKP